MLYIYRIDDNQSKRPTGFRVFTLLNSKFQKFTLSCRRCILRQTFIILAKFRKNFIRAPFSDIFCFYCTSFCFYIHYYLYTKYYFVLDVCCKFRIDDNQAFCIFEFTQITSSILSSKIQIRKIRTIFYPPPSFRNFREI